MRILITGANGFIGKNLIARLNEMKDFSYMSFIRGDSINSLREKINLCDAIIHLAGVNRPKDDSEFTSINVGLTESICQELIVLNKNIPIMISSSTQAKLDNSYGKSKYLAEKLLEELSLTPDNTVGIFQLPGVFGRWCKPNYNSVVATFCHNIVNNIPLKINDSTFMLRLVYIDDVVNEIIRWLKNKPSGCSQPVIKPEYSVSLGELAMQIESFKNSNNKLCFGNSDKDFTRALYKTFLSYQSLDDISSV